MVTLVANVGCFYFLFFEMGRHDDGLDHFPGAGLDGPVVTSQAEGFDLFARFYRERPDFFTVFGMVGIGTMAKLT